MIDDEAAAADEPTRRIAPGHAAWTTFDLAQAEAHIASTTAKAMCRRNSRTVSASRTVR